MSDGFYHLIRELVAAGDTTINAARQMLARKPRPDDPTGSGWTKVLNDIRFEQELRRNGVQKAERAIIAAALAWLDARGTGAASAALDVLFLQCRWLQAEREKLEDEIARIDAEIEGNAS